MRYVRLLNFTALLSLSLANQGFSLPEDLDVAIVGGGLAGLQAAHILHKEGKRNYGLFEARDRWGGRTYSETHHGHVFNMGGEWIDSDHTEMHALAQELGIPLQKETYDAPVRIPFAGKELTNADKVTLLKGILTKLETVNPGNDPLKALDIFYTTEGDYKPLSDILPSTLTPDERNFVECYLKGEEGLPSTQMSSPSLYKLKEDLKEYLQLFEYKASWWKPAFVLNQLAYQHRVVGGMSAMTERMHGQLDSTRTHLNHVLTRVTTSGDFKYHLFFQADGEVRHVTARSVIMTIPFSVLSRVALDESLHLSDTARQAIQTLSYGTNSKIQVVDDHSHDLRYFVDASSQTISWNPPSGKGLTICLGGEEGANLDENNKVATARKVLGSVSGRETEVDPSHLLVKNWSKDPFARGSYSTEGLHALGLDVESDDPDFKGLRSFAKPAAGFIFAGEHTQVENGFMESALRSGRMAVMSCLKYLGKLGR